MKPLGLLRSLPFFAIPSAVQKSKFVIVDAQNFNSPPVATILLPERVPYGAHGSWIPLQV